MSYGGSEPSKTHNSSQRHSSVGMSHQRPIVDLSKSRSSQSHSSKSLMTMGLLHQRPIVDSSKSSSSVGVRH